MNAARLLWIAAGCPDPRKPVRVVSGVCYWCGGRAARGCRTRDVLGSSFTDHDAATAPASSWLCEPCTWAMTGRPPDTLRLWSVLYREDRASPPSHRKAPPLGARIHLHNKADLSAFDAALRDPPVGPWVCAIADSGQLHVVPFAAVNEGRAGWRVRFERLDVVATPAAYARLADAMATLYAAGFAKEEIARGAPAPHKLRGDGAARWRTAEVTLAAQRGSPLFDLSLFLLRKGDADGRHPR